MKNSKAIRLFKVAKERNISVASLINFLKSIGFEKQDPNSKITKEEYEKINYLYNKNEWNVAFESLKLLMFNFFESNIKYSNSNDLYYLYNKETNSISKIIENKLFIENKKMIINKNVIIKNLNNKNYFCDKIKNRFAEDETIILETIVTAFSELLGVQNEYISVVNEDFIENKVDSSSIISAPEVIAQEVAEREVIEPKIVSGIAVNINFLSDILQENKNAISKILDIKCINDGNFVDKNKLIKKL